MKLLYKLILGYVLVALLGGATLYFATQSYRRINQSFDLVFSEAVPLIEALGNVKAEGLRMISSTNEFGFIKAEARGETDEDQSESESAQIDRAIVLYERSLNRYEQLLQNSRPEERVFLPEIKSAGQALIQTSNELLEMKNRNISGEAVLERKELFEKHEIAFLSAVQKALDHEHAELQQENLKVQATIASARRNTLVVFVITFMIALALGSIISRHISNRVRELRRASRAIGRGSRDVIVPVRSGDELGQLAKSFNEMTGQLRASDAALHESREQFSALFQHAPIGIYRSSPDGRLLMANPAMVNLLGFSNFDELAARSLSDESFQPTYPREQFVDAFKLDDEIKGFEGELSKTDGSAVFVRENAKAFRAGDGAIQYYEGTLEDITEARKAAEALRDSEEKLRQAQKMEAIGQLAGGVAHDFNNLLAVIIGYADLLSRRLSADDQSTHGYVEEIKKAGDRARTLVGQLLAFSRKQVLQPKVFDLNVAVRDMDKMLRRLIGEHIEMRTLLKAGLGTVKADPGQIEQVIMNLAVNARDAMPDGGSLTIETENVVLDGNYGPKHLPVEPGQYVMIAVSDTGCGMSAEVKPRIFEPFFTTKEKGKGTGLGLSTVYGIIQQSGGTIWVYSEPSHGTTFKIYLPRVDKIESEAKPAVDRTKELSGNATVLLVEDEEAVRSLARIILETVGYKVLPAENGIEALKVAEQYTGDIDLMLTDVIMPSLGGRELAEKLSLTRPDMRVLFMSGYTDDAIVHHGVLDGRTAFLEKPFAPDALTLKVREVLVG